jgi:hypothetical protein
MNPYDPQNVKRLLTIEEREHYERCLQVMLDNPDLYDDWDIARCQWCLGGQG